MQLEQQSPPRGLYLLGASEGKGPWSPAAWWSPRGPRGLGGGWCQVACLPPALGLRQGLGSPRAAAGGGGSRLRLRENLPPGISAACPRCLQNPHALGESPASFYRAGLNRADREVPTISGRPVPPGEGAGVEATARTHRRQEPAVSGAPVANCTWLHRSIRPSGPSQNPLGARGPRVKAPRPTGRASGRCTLLNPQCPGDREKGGPSLPA